MSKARYFFIVGLDKEKLQPQQIPLFPNPKGERVRRIWTVASSRGEALNKVAARLRIPLQKITEKRAVIYIKQVKEIVSSSKPRNARFKVKKEEWREVNIGGDFIEVQGKDKNGSPTPVVFDKELNMEGNPPITKKERRICYKNAFLFLQQKRRKSEKGGEEKRKNLFSPFH